MIIIAIALVGVAAFLLLGPPPARALTTRLRPVEVQARAEPRRRSRAAARRTVLILFVLAVPAASAALAGLRGLCLGVAAAMIMATTMILVSRGSRRRQAQRRRRDVAQACTQLAAQLRIGQVPIVALRSAAEDCPILQHAVVTADLGGDIVECWRSQADEPGQQGLFQLATGWQVAERTGASMADTLEQIADAMVDDEDLGLVINSEAAGPRASGKIMAVLPLLGIGLGYLIGGHPIRFLFDSAIGWACLVTGTATACAGVLWMERVADRAAVTGAP